MYVQEKELTNQRRGQQRAAIHGQDGKAWLASGVLYQESLRPDGMAAKH